MVKPLNVVIPIDGSRHADRAIGQGKRIGTALGLGIGVMTVGSSVSEIDETFLDEAVADENLDWSVAVVSADIAGAIAEVARQDDALVCMATRGNGRSVALTGSVAEDVVRQSSMPVLLVGPGCIVEEDGPIRELVVAVSGSDSCDMVCRAAVEWADAYRLRLRFVTVVQPTPEPINPATPSDRWFGPEGDEHEYIADLVGRFRAPGLDLDGEVVYDAVSPAGGLALLLRSKPDAILVMGTHGRTGVSRLVHGSTAANIVAESPVPALMLPFHQSQSHNPQPHDQGGRP